MAATEHKLIRGEIRHNESLARYNTWRVGGNAACFFTPADIDDVSLFLTQSPLDEDIAWIGLGSNILVRDSGFTGTVISTQQGLVQMSCEAPGLIRLEAGVTCAKAARFAAKQGLVGLEFLAGIPGTIGGALSMNAGAFGGETWSHVVSVEAINRQGQIQQRNAAEFQVAYRSVLGPAEEWFVAVRFQLAQGDSAESTKAIKQLLAKRNASQPIGLPSCGSVFRNPENAFAAQLIEATGLKGLSVGAACISEKHANFIINTGGATASEIEELVLLVTERVEQAQGIRLQAEFRILGE